MFILDIKGVELYNIYIWITYINERKSVYESK